MKKLLLLATAIFLLVGCGQQDQTLVEDTNFYSNKEFNISFNYPLNWKIDSQERFEHAIGLISGDEYIYFDYQVDLEEQENKYKEDIPEGKVSVKETSLAGHPAKKYGMEGAIEYLIEIEGKFVLINSEFELTQEQEEGMKEILNSLSF